MISMVSVIVPYVCPVFNMVCVSCVTVIASDIVYVLFISSVKRSSSLSDVFQWTVHAFHPVNAISIIFVYLWVWSQYILYCVPRMECRFYIHITAKICYFKQKNLNEYQYKTTV
jgi:hypothetical protein